MNPGQLFSLANTTALVTWLVLIVFQRKPWARNTVALLAVSLFAAAYALIIGSTWANSQGGFGSLDAVGQLFAQPWVLLAGWLHYLAFDLLVGRWEAADAAERRLPAWLVAPCMALTFMFGPVGWLAYCAVRRLPRAASAGSQS